MQITVSGQLIQAAASLAIGAIAGLFYDFLRVLRRHTGSRLITALTDLLFWAVCAVLLFLLGFVLGGGRQRIFMTALSFLGGILYFCTLSRLTVGFCEWIYRVLRAIVYGLAFPFVLTGRILKKFLLFMKKSFIIVKNGILLITIIMGHFRLPRLENRVVLWREVTVLKRRKSSIVTRIIAAILIVYAVTTLVSLSAKIVTARQEQAELQSQIAAKTAANEEMQYAIDNKDDDSVIADIAREKLGLVDRDEQVYYGS